MCMHMCVYSVITTEFGRSDSSCFLQDSQLSDGKYFLQTSDFYYAFHIWEGVKIIHFFPIAEDIFSVEPANGAQHQSSNWIDGLVTLFHSSHSL